MKIFQYILFIITIITFLIAYSINFDFNNVINGGDTKLFLNPTIFIEKSLFVWEDTGTGLALPFPGVNIFYAFPLYLLLILFNNISLASFFYYVILFSIAPLSMFLLTNNLIKNTKLSFFISLFYTFNIYTAIVFHTPVQHILYFFGITPLLVLLFLKIIQLNNYKKTLFLLIYALLFLPLLRIPHMFLIYLGFIPLIAFILSHRIKKRNKQFLKSFIIASFLIILLSLPFLLSAILNTEWVSENPVSKEYVESSLKITSEKEIINTFRGIGTYAWKFKLYNESPGIQAFNFAKYYQENPFFIFMSFYIILLPLSLLFIYYHKLEITEKFKVISLLLIGLISLFVIQNTNYLIGTIGILQTAFRSSWKYFTPLYILSFSLILAILLNNIFLRLKNKKILTILLLVLILIQIVYILPIYVFEKPLHKSWSVRIPNEYYESAEFLNQQNEDFRILPLPLTKHFVGYTPYKWGYAGPDVLYSLVNKPLIDKYINTVASNDYLELIQNLEKSSPEEFIKFSKILNVKYILLRNDVDENHSSIKLEGSLASYKEFLDNSNDIKKSYQFGNLTFYEIKDYKPRIFVVPSNNTIRTNNILEIYNNTFFKNQNINYIYLNETPMTLNVDKTYENINNFNISISFLLQDKNKPGDWTEINHVPIQTEIFKVAISPNGWLYFFIYAKNKSINTIVKPIDTSEVFEKKMDLDIIFKDNTLYIHKNQLKIYNATISSNQILNELNTIKIGSNFKGSEKLKGEIYDLSLNVNDEIILNTTNLILNLHYSDSRITKVLNIPSYNKPIVKKYSPTKYVIDFTNISNKDNMFLIFLTTYSTDWKAYTLDKNNFKRQIPDTLHIKTFNFANGWYLNNKIDYNAIIIEYKPQKWFYMGAIISITTLIASFGYLIYDWRRNRKI